MRDGIGQVEYISAKVRFSTRTDAAVLVDSEDVPVPVWIPRRALAFASQKIVNAATRGDAIEIRIEERVAREKGLLV